MHNLHTLNNIHTNQVVKPRKTLLPDLTGEADYFNCQWYSKKAFMKKREGGVTASVVKNRAMFQSSIVEQILEIFITGLI